MGNWLKTYGETIYGTRKSFMKPADWGVATEKKRKVFLHILNPDAIKNQLTLSNFPYKLKNAYHFGSEKPVKFNLNQTNSEVNLSITDLNREKIDQVIVLKINKKQPSRHIDHIEK